MSLLPPISRGSPPRIHATAVVDPRAELAPDVEVGPFSIIGPGVRIDEGTRLLGHVVITGRATIGKSNVFHPFVAIGGEPQIRKLPVGPTTGVSSLVIGADNVFREHVTVNCSSGETPTSIGAKNLFMAGAHVAHDVTVGSHCVIANAVQLAGHVIVEDWVTFGGLSGVAQRLRRAGRDVRTGRTAVRHRSGRPRARARSQRDRTRTTRHRRRLDREAEEGVRADVRQKRRRLLRSRGSRPRSQRPTRRRARLRPRALIAALISASPHLLISASPHRRGHRGSPLTPGHGRPSVGSVRTA